jgi:hypothetical protein
LSYHLKLPCIQNSAGDGRPLVTFSPKTFIQKNKIGEIEMLLPLLQIEQHFKKESLLQIATEFHLLSHLQNGNKETKIVRVAHIQIGIRKEKHNQGHGKPFATLSFATFTKKIK